MSRNFRVSIRSGSAWESVKGPRMLTGEQLETIARDVRTQPPAEAARHLMPLLGHLTALEDQYCERCRYWVRFDQAGGTVGQCTRPSNDWPGAKLQVLSAQGELLPDDEAHPCLLTPFDWGCRGWQERPAESGEAQASSGR